MTGAEETAQACRDFLAALLDAGFDREEAVAIIVGWMSRPVTDMAAYNAVLQNLVEGLTDR